MKKQIFGRQLKRDTNERKALFKGLSSSLVMYERIETTEEKAKAIRGHVDKLVTKAKKSNSQQARYLLEGYLTIEALRKLLTEIAPRFSDRHGGYTRIIKKGRRFSDNASMVIMEWVEKARQPEVAVAKSRSGKTISDKVESSAKSVAKDKMSKASTKKITAVPNKKRVRKVEK